MTDTTTRTTTRTITVTVPWEPTPATSPNSRLSTRTRRAAHNVARDIADLATADQLRGSPYAPPDHPAIDVTWIRGKGRNRMDLDNLSACTKGMLDGVTRRLGFDDRRVIALTVAQSSAREKGPGHMRVTIRPATKDERRRANP